MPIDAVPPKNAVRIYSKRDLLEYQKHPDTFIIFGKRPKRIKAAHQKSQVLRALTKSPIYCSSFVRIGQPISELFNDHGVPIVCDIYGRGNDVYGVYRLGLRVRYERGVSE